jgi:hypothetical protein
MTDSMTQRAAALRYMGQLIRAGTAVDVRSALAQVPIDEKERGALLADLASAIPDPAKRSGTDTVEKYDGMKAMTASVRNTWLQRAARNLETRHRTAREKGRLK